MKYIFLTQEFYNDYSHCPEIEQKPLRPYVQVLISVNHVLFAVPLRSNIRHPHVLWSDKENSCGLDFSKAVVVSDTKYIDLLNKPYIRPNEFSELQGKERIAKERLEKYIKEYKKAKLRLDVDRNKNLCEYSTLQYFEEYI